MQNNTTQGAAILGAGFISHSHAEALRYCGIRICAVVDSSEKSAAAFAEKWGIEKYGTSEDLLFSEEITSVHICTPPTRITGSSESFWKPGKTYCAKSLSALTRRKPLSWKPWRTRLM